MRIFLPIVSVAECTSRLEQIFPRNGFDTVLSNPLAASAVAAMIYLGSVTDDDTAPSEWRYTRPSMVTWMNDAILERASDEQRDAWYTAAAGGNPKKKIVDLLATWSMMFAPRYADNTRETLRDETFRQWRDLGAAKSKAGLATSSTVPRWILDRAFADLFHPALTGDELTQAIIVWTENHMTTEGKLIALAARRSADAEHAVEVKLPGGGSRRLEAGRSSLILQGVVEQWAPRKLASPMVLTISEPGAKLLVADEAQLSSIGITIDVANLLPDALIVDTARDSFAFWIIEAVATDGPVTEARRAELAAWAANQGIPADRCQFLSAFESRNAGPAKKRLKDLAIGSYAWFLAEPDRELLWDRIEPHSRAQLAAVTPLHS